MGANRCNASENAVIVMILHATTFHGQQIGRVARCVLAALGTNTSIYADDTLPESLQWRYGRGAADMSVSLLQCSDPAPILFLCHTTIPDYFVPRLNKRKIIIVTSVSLKNTLVSSGVTARIEVCNLFVPRMGYYPPTLPFTFLTVCNDAGANDLLIAAFRAAFPTNADVSLHIIRTNDGERNITFDPRVRIDVNGERVLLSHYYAAHVGVFAAHNEAWNFPITSLLSLGRTVIAPFNGADYLDDLCAYRLTSAAKAPLAKQLRFCYENKDDTTLKGIFAYRKMLGFSLSKMAARLQQIISHSL